MRPQSIEIIEVAARDGLQNETRLFSIEEKIALIGRLVAAGARRMEVASFVRAEKVPQMADAEAVLAGLDLPEDVITVGLVMNRRGAHRALDTQVREIGAVCVATDTFGQRNQGQDSMESARSAADIVRFASEQGRRAQATVGAAFGCPFEGEVDPAHVIEMVRILAEAGPVDIGLADTIGVAVPQQIFDMVARVRQEVNGIPVRVHLHNTRNMGIANAWAAVEAGASSLDSSLGGIGGCPFAPKATGNIATEDLIYLLERSRVRTGYDLGRTIEAAEWLTGTMGRVLPGMVSRAGPFPAAKFSENLANEG